MVPDKRLDGAEERLVKLMCEAKVEQPTPALHRRAVRACQASSFSLFALLCQHLSAFDPRESTLVPLDLRAFEALQSAMQVIDIKAAPERRHLLGQRLSANRDRLPIETVAGQCKDVAFLGGNGKQHQRLICGAA